MQADALLPGILDTRRADLHACARPVSADDVSLIGRLVQAPRSGSSLAAAALAPPTLPSWLSSSHSSSSSSSSDESAAAPGDRVPSGALACGGTVPGNVWVNVGHGSKGWTLACGASELLARMMTASRGEAAASLPAADYSPRRF